MGLNRQKRFSTRQICVLYKYITFYTNMLVIHNYIHLAMTNTFIHIQTSANKQRIHMKHDLIDKLYEPKHDKSNKMTCEPSEDSDQPGHPPSLISHHCTLSG